MSLLLQLVGEDFTLRGSGRWYHTEEHDSLVVDAENDKWYWNSRDIFGSALDYLMNVRGMDRKTAERVVKEKRIVALGLPEIKSEFEYTPYDRLVELLWNLGKNKRDYWYRRGLSDEYIDRYRLGYYDGWFTIPLYDNDKFVNFQCRQDIPEKKIMMWYKGFSPILFNSPLLKFVSEVYMTEGIVDCIKLMQEGLPAVSTGSAGFWNPRWFELFKGLRKVHYLADNDSAGHFAAQRVANGIGVNKVEIFDFSDKREKFDTVDYFREGGTVEELIELVKDRSKYAFEMEDYESNLPRIRKGIRRLERRYSGV